MKALIPCRTILEISPFASREETRYYLNGVHIRWRGDRIVAEATDGHRLIVADITDRAILPDGCSFILRTVGERLMMSASRPRRADKGGERYLMANLDANTASVVKLTSDRTKGGKRSPQKMTWDNVIFEPVITVHRVLIDGNFPNIDKVIPTKITNVMGERVGFNATYLGDFASIAPRIRIIPSGEDCDPYLVNFEGREDVFGVIMPSRTTGPALPEWWASAASDAAVAA